MDLEVVRRLTLWLSNPDVIEYGGRFPPLRATLPPRVEDLRALLADYERRGEALREIHALLPAVMDALESALEGEP